MRDYLIVPEGYSPDNIPRGKLVELHTVGPNEDNAEIVVIEDGIVPEHIPPIVYRERLADKLGAELPKVKVAKEVQGETRTKVLGKGRKPDIRKGMPPFPQVLLVDELEWDREVSVDEIVEDIDDLDWFEQVKDFDLEKEVKKCLEYLADKNLAYYDEGDETCHLSPKSSSMGKLEKYMELGEDGYDIQKGPYPIMRLIRDFVSRNVGCNNRDIVKHVYREWNWTRSREGAEYWIDVTTELGYIKETEGKVFEPRRAI